MGKKVIVLIILLIILAALVYYFGFRKPVTKEETPVNTVEEACVGSGGTVTVSSCCLSASDFPNLCLMGACGCSPDNSHDVKICDCGEGKCFNGSACVSQ